MMPTSSGCTNGIMFGLKNMMCILVGLYEIECPEKLSMSRQIFRSCILNHWSCSFIHLFASRSVIIHHTTIKFKLTLQIKHLSSTLSYYFCNKILAAVV